MAYPNKPQITYSCAGFQQSQGDRFFGGTQVSSSTITETKV